MPALVPAWQHRVTLEHSRAHPVAALAGWLAGHAGSNAANTSTLSTAFGTAAQGQARHAHIPSDDLSGALLARKSVSRSCWRTLVAGAARGAACLPLPFLPPGLAGKLCW